MRSHSITSALIMAAALFAACAESPVAPESDDLLRTLSVLQEASLGDAREGAPSLLDRMLHEAIARVAREKGEDGVRQLTAGLRQLAAAAKQAHDARDRDAFMKAMDGVRTESARIVVTVLGGEAVHHAMSTVSRQLAHLGQIIEEAGRSGHDITALRQLAERAAHLHRAAAAALEAGNPVAALRLAADAADLLRHSPATHIAHASLLDRLLHETIGRVAREQGEDAVRTLTSNLRQLHEEARAAREAGDEERFRQKLDAARTESARIVVSVLGPSIVNALRHDLARKIEELRNHLAEAERQGRDVTRPRMIVDQATQFMLAAATALEAGNPVAALRLVAEAADLLGKL